LAGKHISVVTYFVSGGTLNLNTINQFWGMTAVIHKRRPVNKQTQSNSSVIYVN